MTGVQLPDGRSVRYGRTVPHTDPELRTWWTQVVPDSPKYTVDFTAAGAFADRLEEQGDWRHWLMRRLSVPGGYENHAVTHWQRPDGLSSDNRFNIRHRPRVVHDPGGDDSQPGENHFGAATNVNWSTSTDGRPVVFLHTVLPREKGNHFAFSIMTPDEYSGMRDEASSAGVNFPEPPESHRPPPAPDRMSRYADDAQTPDGSPAAPPPPELPEHHHAPALPEHFQSPRHFGEYWATAAASTPGLDPAGRDARSRADAARSVASQLTPGALARLSRHMTGVRHYGDTGDVTFAWSKITGQPIPGPIYGFADTHNGELHIDGEDYRGLFASARDRMGTSETNTPGVYAHELGHLVDGRGKYVRDYLSHSDWFRLAHKTELAGGGLSDYAATHPAEGFAEFFRAAHTGEVPHETLQRHFPNTFAFFRHHGLV